LEQGGRAFVEQPEFQELWKDFISEPRKFGVMDFSDLCVIYRDTETLFLA
jgi:hypothetical protein